MSINKDLPIDTIVLDDNKIPLVCDSITKCVVVPSIFDNADNIFSYDISSEMRLVSSDAESCGVWEHNVSTDTWQQLYTESDSFQYFHRINDDVVFISGPSSDCGLLKYDATEHSIVKIYDGYDWATGYKVDDTEWLISPDYRYGTGPLLSYNTETEEFTVVLASSGLPWTYVTGNTVDGCVFINGYSETLWVYDSRAKTVTQIATNTSASFVEAILDNGDAVLKGFSGNAFYYYNGASKSLIPLGWTAKSSVPLVVLPDNALLFGTQIYNPADNTFAQVNVGQESVAYTTRITNNTYLYSGTSRSNQGLWVYNHLDKTFVQIFTTGRNWTHYYTVNNKTILFSTDTTIEASRGIILFDHDSLIATKVYENGYFDDFIIETNGDVRILFEKNTMFSVLYHSDSNVFERTMCYAVVK